MIETLEQVQQHRQQHCVLTAEAAITTLSADFAQVSLFTFLRQPHITDAHHRAHLCALAFQSGYTEQEALHTRLFGYSMTRKKVDMRCEYLLCSRRRRNGLQQRFSRRRKTGKRVLYHKKEGTFYGRLPLKEARRRTTS